MKIEQLAQVQTGDAVSISEHEGFVLQALLESFETAPGVRFLACISQVNDPIFTGPIVLINLAAREVDAQTSSQARIVHEKAFDHRSPMPQGNVKLLQAMMSVMLHDVPDDRMASYLDHRLGLDLVIFRQTSAESAT